MLIIILVPPGLIVNTFLLLKEEHSKITKKSIEAFHSMMLIKFWNSNTTAPLRTSSYKQLVIE